MRKERDSIGLYRAYPAPLRDPRDFEGLLWERSWAGLSEGVVDRNSGHLHEALRLITGGGHGEDGPDFSNCATQDERGLDRRKLE